MTFDTYSKFIKTHTTLILGVIVLLFAFTVWYKWTNNQGDKANAKLDAANKALYSQVQKNTELRLQVDEHEREYKKLSEQISKENKKIVTVIVERNKEVKAQQAVDLLLPPPELAERWIKLLDLPDGAVVPAPSASFLVDDLSAKATVQALETIPALEQNLKDTEQIVSNKDRQISELEILTDELRDHSIGLDAQLAAADAACKAQVAAVNANQKKSKRNWFLRGLLIGGTIVGYILH